MSYFGGTSKQFSKVPANIILSMFSHESFQLHGILFQGATDWVCCMQYQYLCAVQLCAKRRQRSVTRQPYSERLHPIPGVVYGWFVKAGSILGSEQD